MKSPVTPDIINHLVNATLKVVPCKKSKVYPSPPSSPSNKRNKTLPSLMTFISRIVRYTNVYTGTLLCTQVYLERLASKLPKNAEGLPCTLHRIFLACLIISAKFNNDSSPKNKHWAKYTDGLFKVEDVNLMERQLLQLMNWDISVTEEELCRSLRRLVDPIKSDLKRAARFRRAISKQRQTPAPQCPIPLPVQEQLYQQQQQHITYQHSRSNSASSVSSMSSSNSMDSISSVESYSLQQMDPKIYQLHPSEMKNAGHATYTYAQEPTQSYGDMFLPSLWGEAIVN
jgi:G1/S-specific cyclin PLC1